MASVVSASARDYTQPFYKGLNGIELMRIPAIITLNDGRVLAAMDNRHDHGTDSPQNIAPVSSIPLLFSPKKRAEFSLSLTPLPIIPAA